MKKDDESISSPKKKSRNTGVDVEPNSSATIKAFMGSR
jgi:hypothetical protein